MNRSEIVEFSDTVEIIEECYRLGWSDGLPVVPPVEYKVREMLELSGHTGEEEIITFDTVSYTHLTLPTKRIV